MKGKVTGWKGMREERFFMSISTGSRLTLSWLKTYTQPHTHTHTRTTWTLPTLSLRHIITDKTWLNTTSGCRLPSGKSPALPRLLYPPRLRDLKQKIESGEGDRCLRTAPRIGKKPCSNALQTKSSSCQQQDASSLPLLDIQKNALCVCKQTWRSTMSR